MKSQPGFSLLELLIVLAITAILAAVSFPLYQQHLSRSYRLEAMHQLLLLANKQELWLADYGSYQPDLSMLGYTPAAKEPYRLSIELAADGLGYQLKAEMAETQMAEQGCRILLLDHTGRREAVPADGICWL